MRLSVWAALLEIDEEEIQTERMRDEAKIVSFAASPCDRQVLLDLPRCHPSDPLMKTSNGQLATQRIVRLWLHFATRSTSSSWSATINQHRHHHSLRHQERLQQQQQQQQHHIHYWQGVDSMAATVLSAGKNELLCAKILQKVVELFVPQFAASNAIRARVGRLAGIVRFHDPFAAAHLDDACGVQIDHFALPWILTAFAHVFPLSQTCRLWDALLLHREPVTLLVNFTVAVITANRLQFLNAPDLASSLLLLRQAAQNVVGGEIPQNPSSPSTSSSSSSSAQKFLVPFLSVLSVARKYASVSPPYYPDWDDLDNENCFDSVRRNEQKIHKMERKRKMMMTASGGRRELTSTTTTTMAKTTATETNTKTLTTNDDVEDEDKDDDDDDDDNNDDDEMTDDEWKNLIAMETEELPIKRHVASVRLHDIENYDSCRWENVIVVMTMQKRHNSTTAIAELEKKLVFVVGPRVEFVLGANEEYSQTQSVTTIRSFIRKKGYYFNQQQQKTGSENNNNSSNSSATNRYIVAVAAKHRNQAIDVALHLAGEGIEHVATLEF